jgi:hypothetical protein
MIPHLSVVEKIKWSVLDAFAFRCAMEAEIPLTVSEPCQEVAGTIEFGKFDLVWRLVAVGTLLVTAVRSPATAVVGGRAIVGSWHMWRYWVVPSHVVCGRAGRDGNLAHSLCQTAVVRPCLQSEHGDAEHGLLLFDVPNFDGEGAHHLRQLIKLLRQTNNGVCRFRARTCVGRRRHGGMTWNYRYQIVTGWVVTEVRTKTLP